VTDPPIVEMRSVHKSFGPVEVLHGVDFDVAAGEAHVLAGENGAGKSTLVKILAGVLRPDGGAVRWGGGRRSVATIHQELSLVPTMTVRDNLFLGRERRGPLGLVDFGTEEEEGRRILARVSLDLPLSRRVGDLPIAARQLVEVARALAREADLFLFDEPTSALDETDARRLFERIDELRKLGRGVVYITHRMEEIYRVADRITVLRDGRRVGTARPADLPRRDLVRWMVGRDEPVTGWGRRTVSGPPVLTFRVGDASFSLRRGEILGLAGLQGSGASSVVRNPNKVYETPRAAIDAGLVLLPSDRRAEGLLPDQGIVENVSLASLDAFTGRFGFLDRHIERLAVGDIVRDVRLSAPSLSMPVRALSGGNQQKVLLARCLLARPKVLLLDEPTRGIDVGAKADVYALLRRCVDQGISILLTTSEWEELLALADRILVLRRGKVVAEFDREAASREAILHSAMGGEEGR
jgi:ABC-type sugar transport system ATPase subunit